MSKWLKARIEKRLVEIGKTARGASLEVGTNPDLIRNILRGVTENPRADTIRKLAEVLQVDEQWLLQEASDKEPGDFAGEVRRVAKKVPSRASMPKDIPVYGTAAGALAGSFNFEGGVIDWVRRPPALDGAKDIYAIYIQGDSMVPEHRPGDLRVVNPHRPPAIGDTVIIQIRNHEHAETEAYIKILAGRKNGMVVAKQHNPESTIEYDQRFVVAMHRVMTMAELIGV